MLTHLLLWASKSPRCRQLVTRSPVARAVADRFVAGDSFADAIAVVSALRAWGLYATVGYVGEDCGNTAQVEAVRQDYECLLAALADLGLSSVAEVSVKLSALGLALPGGEDLAAVHLAGICAAAREAGTTVTVDMEGSATIDATLRVVRGLRERYPSLGVVVQSMVHRSSDDCRELSSPGSRVRLVKGAYREPASIAEQDGQAIDAAYLRCLRVLMEGDGYPMIATHDDRMIRAAQETARGADRSPDDYEYQMLYGVRRRLQRELALSGARVRVYVPYGSAWYGYFMRRLAERPANLAFFLGALVRA